MINASQQNNNREKLEKRKKKIEDGSRNMCIVQAKRRKMCITFFRFLVFQLLPYRFSIGSKQMGPSLL
jgi:hypothetical protein